MSNGWMTLDTTDPIDERNSLFRFLVEDSGGSTSSRSRSESRGADDGKSSESNGELHLDMLLVFEIVIEL